MKTKIIFAILLILTSGLIYVTAIYPKMVSIIILSFVGIVGLAVFLRTIWIWAEDIADEID